MLVDEVVLRVVNSIVDELLFSVFLHKRVVRVVYSVEFKLEIEKLLLVLFLHLVFAKELIGLLVLYR